GIYGAVSAPSFDVAIAASGDALAIRGADGKLAIIGQHPSLFAAEQWLRADADGRDPHAAITKDTCDRIGCVGILPDGRAFALVLDRAAFAEDCLRADVIVSPLYAPIGCAAPLIFDREKLEETGAVTLVARKAGWAIMSDRGPDEDRPWSPAPKERWGRAGDEKPADEPTGPLE
ncbi:MAG TPA: competence protein ComEC, partial [Methylovirgula sp.]|nr:competence protein ComEC [Methylovirgula sp.]